MLEEIKKVKNIVLMEKQQQKLIVGGFTCPTGCFDTYIADNWSNRCAIPGFNGNSCFGTITNNKCCL